MYNTQKLVIRGTYERFSLKKTCVRDASFCPYILKSLVDKMKLRGGSKYLCVFVNEENN